jgi:hypothetical protein
MKKVTLIFALLLSASALVIAQPQLSWRFANYEVINAGAQLQFDVEVKADIAGSFHRDLQIYFDYNTAGFGSDIVANGKISYTPLTLMDVSKYTVVNMADNTSSKFAIITEAIYEGPTGGFPGSATYFKEITTSYQGLLRFTIDVASNIATTGITFDNVLMNGGEYYQSLSNTDPLKYLDGMYEDNFSTLKMSSLYGTITYNNSGSTPLKLCSLTLSPGGDTYGPTLNNGKYYFTGMNDGGYTIATTCTNTWGGLQSVDATLASRYILNLYVLSPLQQKAVDVNQSGTVQSIDVTMMKRRLLGQTYPLWTAPDFVFIAPSATVTGGLGTIDYKGLCSGDLNGSWSPPLD